MDKIKINFVNLIHQVFENTIFCYLLISALTFSIFYLSLAYGSPMSDDYVLLNVTKSLDFLNIFAHTWRGIFDVYDHSITSHSELYRPLVDLTFVIDNLIKQQFDNYNYYYTNLILFLCVAIVFFKLLYLFSNNNLIAILLTTLFIFNPQNKDAVFALANRTDVIFSIFALLSFYFYYKKLFYFFIISVVLALLSKESAVILVGIPLFFKIMSKQFFKIDKISDKTHILLTLVIFIVVFFYFLIRVKFFDGIGSYATELYFDFLYLLKNLIKVIFYSIGITDKIYIFQYGIFLLPILFILFYSLIKGGTRIQIGIVVFVAFILFFFGPAIIFAPAKRFAYISVFIFSLFFIFLYIEFYSKNRLKVLYFLSIICLGFFYIAQSTPIYAQNKVAFLIKNQIDREINEIQIPSKKNIYVIFPNYISRESTIFLNGIKEYLRLKLASDPTEEGRVIPLFVLSKYDIDETYSYNYTCNRSDLTFSVSNNTYFHIPQFSMSHKIFDNKLFIYRVVNWKNESEPHTVKVTFKTNHNALLLYENAHLKVVECG